MTMQVRPYLSVVIPAYNEEARIHGSLGRLVEYLAGARGPAEVLVVDDGSSDRTATVVEELAATVPAGGPLIRVLRNGRNRGKGYSIKHCVLSAEGEHLLVSDADFSTPIEELPRLLRPVEAEGYGIAIGSRGLAESRVEKHQPLWRESMGRCFNALVRAITGLPFRDTQCGFKVMRRDAVLPLFRAARVERFAYDVEILYLAGRAGVRAIEVPVIWRDASGSKVRAMADSIDMLKDILWIVWRDRRGGYGTIGRPRPATPEPPPAGGRGEAGGAP
jgi:glycosyltransferase involved in cell wall biosynthesis